MVREDFHNYYNCGIKHFEKEEYEKAIENYNQAIDISKNLDSNLDEYVVQAYLGCGDSYFYLKEHKKAIENYNWVVDLDVKKSYIDVYFDRGNCYLHLTEYSKAIEDYNKFINQHKTDINTYSNRAYCYFKLEKYREAIADYDTLIHLDINHKYAYFNRAYCYFKLTTELKYFKELLDLLYNKLKCNFDSYELFNSDLMNYSVIAKKIFKIRISKILETMTVPYLKSGAINDLHCLYTTTTDNFYTIEKLLKEEKIEILNAIGVQSINKLNQMKSDLLNEIENYIVDIEAINNMTSIILINKLDDLNDIKQNACENQRVFRGMNRGSWKLQANIFREKHYKNRTNLLKNFKREATALSVIDFAHYTTADWVSLMQHHGCETPLLDWTQSLSVSLFFSIYTNNSDDRSTYGIPIIYVYNTKDIQLYTDIEEKIEEDYKGECKDDKVLFFAPNLHHTRAYIQKSIFSYQFCDKPLDTMLDENNLQRYIINPLLIDKIKQTLESDCINISSIYPDLEHLSSRLRDINSSNNIDFGRISQVPKIKKNQDK